MKANVAGTEIERFVTDVFESVGMSHPHAVAVARALAWANLRGVDSHGLVRLPRYIEMVDQGIMNVHATPTTTEPTPSSIVIDADRAPGPVVMAEAVDQLINRASDHGIVMALVSRMTHSGALGYYAGMAARAGLAGIAINAGIPMMPYHGAHGAALGTNPIAIAVPSGGGDPLVFDMATSAISMGKLMLARRSGTPLEPGCAVDEDGQMTVDPKRAAMTLPLAGPKGSGLALMIECLASLLSGHAIVAQALEHTGEGSTHRQNALIIAIDISKFIDPAEFGRTVRETAAALKAMPLATGSQGILMPGERGDRVMAERRCNGVPLRTDILNEVSAIAERLGVKPLATLS